MQIRLYDFREAPSTTSKKKLIAKVLTDAWYLFLLYLQYLFFIAVELLFRSTDRN
jgi:hypothetical protein